MKKILISLGSVASLGLPVLALAAGDPKLDGYLGTLMKQASNVLSSLLVLLIALSVVWFVWNVIKYAMSGEEDGKEKAKAQMINGIIAITVVVSIWGIVAILRGAFGVTGGSASDQNYNSMIPGASSAPSSVARSSDPFANSRVSDPLDVQPLRLQP